VESAHAVAALPEVLARLASEGGAEPLPREMVVVLGLSGRGDKDLAAIAAGDSRAAQEVTPVDRSKEAAR